MHLWEWIVAAYFAYLAALSGRIRSPRARWVVLASSAVLIAAVAGVAAAPQAPAVALLRQWIPAVYLLAGYWLTGVFFEAPMPQWEARLAWADTRLLHRTGLLARAQRAPRPVLEVLELAYFSCPFIIPLGLLVFGLPLPPEAAGRYWPSVLLAEFLSFGALPWIQTRPPRRTELASADALGHLAFRRLNAMVVRYGHVGANTFPSGHVAGAVTVALVAIPVAPVAGGMLLALAVLIFAASVVGRYHYLADAVAGALVAVTVATAATRFGL